MPRRQELGQDWSQEDLQRLQKPRQPDLACDGRRHGLRYLLAGLSAGWFQSRDGQESGRQGPVSRDAALQTVLVLTRYVDQLRARREDGISASPCAGQSIRVPNEGGQRASTDLQL